MSEQTEIEKVNKRRWIVLIYQEYVVKRDGKEYDRSVLHSRISIMSDTAQKAVTIGETYIEQRKILNAHVHEIASDVDDLSTEYFARNDFSFSE